MKPGKQRKKVEELPKHARHKQMSVHLSKELTEKYNKRNFPIRKGDKVKVVRGKQKGKEAKVMKVLLKKYKVLLEGVTFKKKDGTEEMLPVSPSNLVLTELDLTDKRRADALQRTVKG